MGAKGTRVRPTKQLGDTQETILFELAREEEEITGSPLEDSDQRAEYKEFQQKGIRWSAHMLFCGSATGNDIINISKSLKRLEDRGLVVTFDAAEGLGRKRRTSHVRLTNTGRSIALKIADKRGYEPLRLTRAAHIKALREEIRTCETEYQDLQEKFGICHVKAYEGAPPTWVPMTFIPTLEVDEKEEAGYDMAHLAWRIRRLSEELKSLENKLSNPK